VIYAISLSPPPPDDGFPIVLVAVAVAIVAIIAIAIFKLRKSVVGPKEKPVTRLFCGKCGADIDPKSKFCRKCGKTLPEQVTA